ncbi:MAG: hypothetical protein AB7O97_00275 [Planctomycetota bacterium]
MPAPTTFDFTDLADAVVRNNVGVDGILVAVRARCEGATVRVEATRQTLPATTTAETTATQPWLWFEVEGWDVPGGATVRCIGASSGPDDRPQVLPGG